MANDYFASKGWLTKYAQAEDSTGAWQKYVAEVQRSEMDNFNTPDLDQGSDSILRPGETLDDFDVTFRKANAEGGFQQLVQNTNDGSRPGYAGKELTPEQKANVKVWMGNTNSTLQDFNKMSPAIKGFVKTGKTTGIKQTAEYWKEREGKETKQFRNWLNKQDPKTLTADSVDDLIQQSKIKTTSKNQRSGLINAINKIMEEKEFSNFKNIKLGREYSQKNIDQLSDDLLKAYAKDDITLVMDPKHKSSISEIRTNRRGSLDKAIKNTGLDEETIFNLLDDREAYVELEHLQATTGGRPVDPNKAKFYKQAENWIVKNSKRYADPDKFKKAFTRTFGKDNNLIQKINKTEVLGKRGSTLGSVPFSDWFRTNIMGSSEQGMRGQTKPSYSGKQLNDIFKTAIYTNNKNVRDKITSEIKNIIPEPSSKRIPDIRDALKENPLLKKFGLNEHIRGPVARLLAKEVGDDLVKQISTFRKPWLGTFELINYLKDKVDPKYKSMFEESGKAVRYAQQNQWPEAKKALNISESIMFDHKVPKALMQLGYADEIEYIKLNPTSADFNTKIKRIQFDMPMVKLANQWGIETTLEGKAKIVGEMNTLKDSFSKKYGNYLDNIKITPDKTGKPMFSSTDDVVNKKTDLVGSFKTSLQQEQFPNMNKKMQDQFLGKIAALGGKGCNRKVAFAGGRMDFNVGGSANCISKGLERLKNPTNLSPGENANLRALKEMSTGAKGVKILGNAARVLGKLGLVSEGAIGGLLALNDYAGGANNEEILSNFTYGLAGKSQEEQLTEQDPQYGLDRKILTNYAGLNSMGQRKDSIGRMSVKPGIEKKLIETIKKEQQPFMTGPRNEEFDMDKFYKQQEKTNQADIDYQKAKDQRSLERRVDPFAQEAITEETDFMASEGGLANLMKKYYDKR